MANSNVSKEVSFVLFGLTSEGATFQRLFDQVIASELEQHCISSPTWTIWQWFQAALRTIGHEHGGVRLHQIFTYLSLFRPIIILLYKYNGQSVAQNSKLLLNQGNLFFSTEMGWLNSFSLLSRTFAFKYSGLVLPMREPSDHLPCQMNVSNQKWKNCNIGIFAL